MDARQQHTIALDIFRSTVIAWLTLLLVNTLSPGFVDEYVSVSSLFVVPFIAGLIALRYIPEHEPVPSAVRISKMWRIILSMVVAVVAIVVSFQFIETTFWLHAIISGVLGLIAFCLSVFFWKDDIHV